MPLVTRRWLAVAIAAACLSATYLPSTHAQQAGVNTAALVKSMEAAAADGTLNLDTAFQALMDNGITGNAFSDEVAKLNGLMNKAEAAGKGPSQNPSFNADWNLGMVKRGYTYTMNFPLTNGCRIPQLVTITYPTAIALVGPEEVPVPPHTTVTVELSWKVPELPPIIMPPIGINLQQTIVTDFMFMSEPGGSSKVTNAQGTYTYVCDNAVQAYSIWANMLAIPENKPPDSGGGGKPKPKGKRSPCDTIWTSGLFTPDPDHRSPESCTNELRPLALDLVNNYLPLYRSLHPDAWSWLPPASAVDQMSARDILALREHARQVLRDVEGIK